MSDCWSLERVVAETFLDLLNAQNNLRWLEVGRANGAFTQKLIAPLCVRSRDGDRSVR